MSETGHERRMRLPAELAGPAAIGPAAWIECPECGLFQPLPAPRDGHRRVCQRCRASFGHGRAAFETASALAVTAIVLFAVAQSYPLIGIELRGLSQSVRIGSGVVGLADHDLLPLAFLVLLVSIAAPLFRVVASIYVLASIGLGRRQRHLATIFRVSQRLRPWAMLDVLLLGTLIALTKLHDLAATEVGIGLWTLGLLVLTLAALDSSIDRDAVWTALRPAPTSPYGPEAEASIGCLACNLVQPAPAPDRPQTCARCGARLFRRKPDSVARTWALVVTGLLLYIPANAYPAVTVVSFGRSESSTILGGVLELMNGEDWPLALLIFTASIAVPVLKLLGLSALLLSVQFRLRSRLMDRTRLYRVIEFVAALLTALVTLGQVATIEPGYGILAFGGVVVATMIAAESFDPRLIWDAASAGEAGSAERVG
jgi:paraquat-inducible protein A